MATPPRDGGWTSLPEADMAATATRTIPTQAPRSAARRERGTGNLTGGMCRGPERQDTPLGSQIAGEALLNREFAASLQVMRLERGVDRTIHRRSDSDRLAEPNDAARHR